MTRRLVFFVILSSFMFISCKKGNGGGDNQPYVDPPFVKGTDTLMGFPGDKIKIFGEGFSYVNTENEVWFNGVPAEVNSSSDGDIYQGEYLRALIVTIPSGVTSGPIIIQVFGGRRDTIPLFTIPKKGYVMVYYTNVDKPTTATLNDKPVSIITGASSQYCSDPALTGYKVPVAVGVKYRLRAESGLGSWDIPDISISAENECKAINLSAANIISNNKYRVLFSNEECGFYYINVWLDGTKIGQMQDEGQGNFPSCAVVADVSVTAHTYKAISHNGHTWTGSFTPTKGETVRIDLSKALADPVPSGYCKINIYRSVYTVPVDVTLQNDDNPSDDNVGQIRGGAISNFCTAPLIVSVIRKVGTYNFQAIENSGAGYWNGNVSANVSGGCVTVKLN